MASVILGSSTETGEPVSLAEEDRLRGLYIIGKTGTGKTTLIEDLVVQDAEAGLGLCVLDPHGDLVSRLLARIPQSRQRDIVLLDPRDTAWPFGLNPLSMPESSDRDVLDTAAGQFVELIDKLWGPEGTRGTSWGPNIPMLLRNVAKVLLANQGSTIVDIRPFLTDRDFRKSRLQAVDDPYVLSFWDDYDAITSRQEQRNLTSSTLNKLDEFLSPNLVRNIYGQRSSMIDFGAFMNDGNIVLVPLGLGRLGESFVDLLGSTIVLKILNAALHRESMAEGMRRQFNLYADEYQRFATPAFAVPSGRVQAVRSRSRELYCRPRIEVEDEAHKHVGATMDGGSGGGQDQQTARVVVIDAETRPTNTQMGSELRTRMYCLSCGRQLAIEARFCTECGAETDSSLRRRPESEGVRN